jgi:peptidoglycan-associated lipoprotein
MKVHHGVRVSVIALGLAVAACSSMKTKVEEPVNPPVATAAATRPATAAADSASTSAAGDLGGLSANGIRADKSDSKLATTSAGKAGKAGSGNDGSTQPEQNQLHFDYDAYSISAGDSDILAAHAAYLAAHKKVHVRLEGHADERGTQEYNMALGERRAKAARFFLLAHGVRVTQLDVISYGKTKPLDTGSSEEAWAKNRRVEIIYR